MGIRTFPPTLYPAGIYCCINVVYSHDTCSPDNVRRMRVT